MTFIHPLLLGGLLLVGLPIVLHLIMRQQPKHLIFPAFRFLQLRHRTNQRKLRLRHIVLLALRMLLIALMCLALARPRLFSDRFGFLGDQQTANVVLVVDTSPSMEYAVAGKSRLQEARDGLLDLIDDLGDASRIAVLDTADPVAEWAPSRAAARERLLNLTTRAANRPVTDALDAAFRLFGSAEFQEPGDEGKPRFVYVASDRTPASWDATRAADLKDRRNRLPDPKPKLVYVDVGVDQPADLAVADVEVKPQAVPANRPAVLHVTVQATGPGGEAELSCRFDGDPSAERKPVRLGAGQRQVVTFERPGLKEGYHQAEIVLAPNDSLPGNNVRYATVLVRKPQKVLVLCDEPADAKLWQAAIDNQKLYQCDVRSVHGSGAIDKLTPSDLAAYQAVCLVSVSAPTTGLWESLDKYVRQGGGLAIALGGSELVRDAYEGAAARSLLPAELVKVNGSRDGVALTEYQFQHRLLAKFRDYLADPTYSPVVLSARAYQYWAVKPADGATVLVRYADRGQSPAVLERTPAESSGRGKVVLFTTPMDGRRDRAGHPANNFMDRWYYLVLVNETVRYLAGEAEDASLNHVAGPAVAIALPLAARFPTYTLAGPGLTGADTLVQRAETAGELRLAQPRQPGSYVLTGGNRKWETRFSVNAAPDECLLLPRLSTDTIEEVFGPESVVQPGPGKRLRDALEGQFRQPVELFPWLMILLLLVLTVENLLANKFYRQPQPTEGSPPV
jgi:hypothetical protein